MRGIIEPIRQFGAKLVVVGNGSPRQAASFRDEHCGDDSGNDDSGEDFTLLTDPGRRAYRAAGLRRSVGATLNPSLLGNAWRAFKKGFRQQSVQGDPWQQGGVFVIVPGGETIFSQVSTTAGDHADPEAIVEALARYAERSAGS